MALPLDPATVDRLVPRGIGAWSLGRLLQREGEVVLDAVLQRLGEPLNDPRELLQLVAEQARQQPARLQTPERLRALVGALGAVDLRRSSEPNLPHREDGGRLLQLAALEPLLRVAGAAVQPALRELLDGPSRGAVVVERRGQPPVAVGAKISALRLLAGHLTADDVPRLAALVLTEDPWTALAAAVPWLALAGPAVLPAVLDQLLAAACHSEAQVDALLLPTLAGSGAAAAEWAVSRLADDSFVVRHRAVKLLVRIGPAAVEPLAAGLLAATSWLVIENGQEALGQLDRGRLHDVLRERDLQTRGLSRAAAPGDATRGLSRPDDAR
ncbi:MAG: hypothetical protein IT204_17275 [Fimbriimonadaceae bacterium]|nr:hypothetical protein [Fimbriimonadaceae bacterium]